MLGGRLAFNDSQSTDLLVGLIYDPDFASFVANIEGSRRIGERWKLSIEARSYTGIGTGDPLYAFRDDDYLQVELGWFF